MAFKRKRPSKRRLSSSDDEEEDTFINNSDYMTSEGKQEQSSSSHRGGVIDGHVSQASNDNVNEEGKIGDEAVGSAEVGEDINDVDNEDEGADGEIRGEVDDEFESASSEFDKSTTESGELYSNLPRKDSKSGLQALSNDVLLPPPSRPDSQSSTNPPLSYSQQQSEIILQSPSKRREITSQSVKSKEPRLVINQLVLINFKSYAGRQVIGPFNASFSAVVGPNGSGKSNVIDSMLFVFGFRASKMRQAKLSELIHNSSDGQKLDFCQVDIHFHHVLDNDNTSELEFIPNSELVVSRKAFRNNSSQYYINGTSSNYTQVTQLLRDKGVDLDHKRFLILQGEVESIAQMKAKAERENDDGLLEYLEDIIGTSKYKQLIEQNLTKVDDLNDICLEKENRFVLVEKDKEMLEEKKNEALKFLETEKKLIGKKSVQYQASIAVDRRMLQENEEIVNNLRVELEKEKESNKELTQGIKEFTKKQNKISQSIADLNNQIKNISNKQKAVNKVKVSIEEKIKNLDNKLKKIKKTKGQSEHIISSSTQKLKANNELSFHYKNELSQLLGDLEVAKGKLDEIRKKLTDKTSEFTKEIESLQTKLEPWNDKLKEKESVIQLSTSAIEMLESQRENMSKQLDEARQRLIDIKTEGKQNEAEFIKAEEKLSQIIEQIGLGEEQCNYSRRQLDARRQQLAILRQRTQDSINSLANYQNKNKVLSSLVRLAKSGRIDGFYGRLGDLGIIDDIYDVAISTACPGLDSIVVETVETAQSCIDYLRKNKLGYANFICLNKLRKFDLSAIQTPGNPANVKRLFDLIIPQDPKFAPAFYSKLYNTLVASNLQEAKRVAYGPKRWKVVTLDGKVVDTSGTMSGGGNYFAKGGMRLSNSKNADTIDISPEEVEQMKDNLSKSEANFELANREYQEKEQALRHLKDLKPETEFTISRLKLDIEALASEKKQVSSICKNLMAESENNNTRQLDLQVEQKKSERSKLVEEKQILKSQMFDLESKIKELEGKIMEAGGVELKIQSSKVDSIKQKIEIINEKISNDRMATRKLENDIKRHTKIVEESEIELHGAETELKSIKSQQNNKHEESESLIAELNKIEHEKEEKEEELESIVNLLEEKQTQINEFKSVEIDIENKIEKFSSIIKKCNHQIKEDEESLRGLVVRDATPYIDWLPEGEQCKYNGSVIEELTEEQLDDIDMGKVNNEIEELENYMNNIKVDIEVLKEYGTKKVEFESRRKDLNNSVEERDELKNYCEELKRKRLDEFMEGFNNISMSLKEMYQMITMGGNAELELVDSLDPFSEGILFSVMPPKKSWRNISNLSGGEKTLSSLALVFALHKYKPTPLYVMDEIDAALDFRNVSIVANYIKERTKNAQFIVISLRNNMFELAQQLVGIYKVNNMTQSISLKNKDFLGNDK